MLFRSNQTTDQEEGDDKSNILAAAQIVSDVEIDKIELRGEEELVQREADVRGHRDADGSKSKEKDERQVEMKRRVGLPVSVCERQEEPGKIEPGQRNGCRGNAQTTESTECSILFAVEKVGSKLKREIEQDDTKKNSLNQTGSQSG